MSAQVVPKYTFPFDEAGTLADVYLPRSGNGLQAPTVVYWHGGGLSCGDRGSYLPIWFISELDASDVEASGAIDLCAAKLVNNGYAFISADYRLLPPCTGHDILQDVLNFVNWVASPDGLNGQLRRHNETICVDVTRLVAAGTSAGGYLAYLAGIHVRIKQSIRGVLSLYGMGGDLLTSHYLQRKTRPFFRGRPLLDPAQFEHLLSTTHPPPVVSGSPLEYGPDGIPSSPRMFITRVLLQEGTFLDYLTGDHGLSRRLAMADKPTMSDVPEQHHLLFPEACISQSFPPTCLVHGTDDSAVLIEESRAMRDRLQHIGVPCQLFEVVGAEHSFDYAPGHEEVLDKVFRVVEGWFM